MLGVAVNEIVVELPEQTVVPPEIVAVGKARTVIVIGLEVAIVGEAHASFEVIMQVITSLFASVVVVYIGLFVPTGLPFFFHA